MRSMNANSSAFPYANNRYLTIQASIPKSMVFLNPNRAKNQGSNNMKITSDACPMVILPAGLVTLISPKN